VPVESLSFTAIQVRLRSIAEIFIFLEYNMERILIQHGKTLSKDLVEIEISNMVVAIPEGLLGIVFVKSTGEVSLKIAIWTLLHIASKSHIKWLL
jgi:hypothetical protein